MKDNFVLKHFVSNLILLHNFCNPIQGFCNLISDIFGPTKELHKHLTIYFHGDIDTDSLHECYEPKLESVSQMKFSRSYSHEPKLNITRFVGPASIMIVPLKCSSAITSSEDFDWFIPEVKLTFWKLLLLPTTLLVLSRITDKLSDYCLYAEENDRWDSQILRLHFIIALQIETFHTPSTLPIKYKVNGYDYCKKTDLDLANIQISNVAANSILCVHKKYLYNANNKQISAWISWIHDGFYEESKTKEYLYDIIYKSQKYKMFSSAKYCWGKQRTAIEISKQYNISYTELGTQMGIKSNILIKSPLRIECKLKKLND